MSISSSSSTDRTQYRSSDITRLTGLSADTLCYYEKISLLPPVHQTASGVRCSMTNTICHGCASFNVPRQGNEAPAKECYSKGGVPLKGSEGDPARG